MKPVFETVHHYLIRYLPLRAFLRLINTKTSQLDRIPWVKKKKFKVSCDGLKIDSNPGDGTCSSDR